LKQLNIIWSRLLRIEMMRPLSGFQITQLGNCSARRHGGSRNLHFEAVSIASVLTSLINVKIIYREENKVRWPNLSFLLSLIIIEALAAG
jgi:hypothetical protein